ncbi:hypothetical protein Tco_0242239 [Tanacetum coccineum]
MVSTQGSRQDGVLSINECKISGTQAGDAVFSKMDSLQNQLNQVMMMLQNPQGQCDPKLLAAGRYMFIADGNNQKIAHGVQSDGLYIIQSGQDETSSPHPTLTTTPAVNFSL